MAPESALVVVSPDDTIAAIAQKVRDVRAENVKLLIPDDTLALQARSGFTQLCDALRRDRIGLLIISSDERTLDAARLNRLETLGIQGARVSAPQPNGKSATLAHPTGEQEAAFLDALDNVTPHNRYADLSDDDAEMFAALDDLSDAIQQSSAATHRDDEDIYSGLDAALEEWSDVTDDGGPGRARSTPAPRQRVRADDIALSDEERRRASGNRRTEARRERPTRTNDQTGTRPSTGRHNVRDPRMLDLETSDIITPWQRYRYPILTVLLVLILALLALWWVRSNRVTIDIQPPSSDMREYPIASEIIPLVNQEPPSAPAASPISESAALVAVPVSADAVFTVTGQVISETLSPFATAKGIISIYNQLPQPIDLPIGTEFVATNDQGQEVRFTLDAPGTIPPAVTSSSIAGNTTVNGTIDVGITARSPGGTSNVGQDTITQLIIPGQAPLISGSSNIILRNPPLEGGSDQPQRVVTSDDVQRALGEALTGLYNAGVQALRTQIDERTQGVDLTSISPTPQELGAPESYDPPIINPAIGQPVDPNNPTFTISVKTHFNGLASPLDRPVSDQLQQIVPAHLSQNGKVPCQPGDLSGFRVTSWRWDGTKLTIDGDITCTVGGGLTSEVQGKVRDAVRGQTRADAITNLEALKTAGTIGDYTLPERDSFPRFDFLMTVQLNTSPATENTP